MKRFDKGYVYSALLSDLFSSLVLVHVFFGEFLFGEEAAAQDFAVLIPVFVIAFIAIYLCFIAYRIMYYRTSGYELTETEIKCNRGVLFRKRSVLDYKRVHAINKRQSIFHRIFGVAVLTVDSGSANTSHQAEITIVERAETVDILIKKLNALKEGGTLCADDSEEEVLLCADDSLYRFTSGKKMLYTLINIASTVFFTALFAVFAITVIGVCKAMLQLDFLGTWGQYLLYAILITVAVMLLLSFFSFIGSIVHSFVGYYGFAITKRDNNIQISYGLLEKHTNTFSYDRIKAVKISQGLVQRILGFASIRLEVIGYTVNSGDDDKNADLGVLVPFCKYEEISEILGKVLPDYIPSEKQTKSVSLFPFVSWFLLIFGIIAVITLAGVIAVMAVLEVSSAVISAVAFSIFGVYLIVIALEFVSAALSYQTDGIAVDGERITAYTGSFTKKVTVFMSKNLISTESVTTPLRKKGGITSLVMHLKTNAQTNEVKVRIQRDTVAEELEKLLTL